MFAVGTMVGDVGIMRFKPVRDASNCAVIIMEEVHTILSAGAGGSTKLVGPAGRIERVFNHKYPLDYLNHFDEVLARKAGIGEFYGCDSGIETVGGNQSV